MASVNPEPIGSIEYRTRDGHEGKIEIGGQQEIQFGRGSSCSVVIRGVHASAKHFSVYAIIPDPDHVQEIPPLVYCQDRSSVGTYINKRLVKPKSAILLQDGWSIIIRKELQSCFLQAQPNPRIFSSKLMRREIKHFQNDYEISDQLLGVGGWGRVQMAYGNNPLDQYACKVVKAKDTSILLAPGLPNDMARSQKVRKRRSIGEVDIKLDRKYSESYMKEATVLAKLDHPNIIRLLDAFHGVEHLYMMLELYPGGDLFSYLYRVGAVPQKDLLRILYQILSGVEYLHALNIVHRDLKLENILLTRLDPRNRLVIADFGNARCHVTGSRHRMNSFVGTTGYQAPELSLSLAQSNSLAYTESVDLWAIGIMSTMLVSGQETRDLATPPRNSKSPYPPTIDKLNGWASLMSPLRQLIRRMLAFEPAQRISAAHAKGVVGTIWPPLLEGYELAVEDWGPRRKQASALVHDMRRHFRDEEAVKEGRPGEEGLRQGPVAEDVGPSRFWGRKENASPAEAEQDGLPVADGDATGAVVVDEADMLNTSSLLRALT